MKNVTYVRPVYPAVFGLSASGNIYTLQPSEPIERGYLVISTYDSDGFAAPGLGKITRINANGTELVSDGDSGIPVSVFAADSRFNPLLKLDLSTKKKVQVFYTPDMGSSAVMALVKVEMVE